MNAERFSTLTHRYPTLRVAVVGDICLDRYFDLDPARQETSIETGRPVHNIVSVRCQPGAAGTILNNLAALGVQLFSVGLRGDDGEGWELHRALGRVRGGHRLISHPSLHTFTYTKPLLHHPNQPPEELDRLDLKNWQPTPPEVEDSILDAFQTIASQIDALILMDQVDLADTGVLTRRVRQSIGEFARSNPQIPVLADSRRSLRDWPPMIFKMNASELDAFTHLETPSTPNLEELGRQALRIAHTNRHPVFVSLSERGILGATPDGQLEHAPSLPLRGPIDIVGAGDAVTANLACALASGASLQEALQLAMAAASVVIHQLGTTGTASLLQIRELIDPR